jgi:branched-chain amino acid transport system ATP-binding protein
VALLTITGLSKAFGGLAALSNIDLEVHQGEIVGLIGPNGSGKTTLFAVIMGSLKSDQGTIMFQNGNITGLKPHQICVKGIARTFQLTRPFHRMSCLENVIVGRSFGTNEPCSLKEARKEAEEILAFTGLIEKGEHLAATLNIIERKRLEFARALATHPRLLLLDEIMAGLNPLEMKKAVGLIRRINDSGVTVVIVEHVMKALLGISTRVFVLDAGRKIAEGTPGEIVQNQAVIDAYFGKDGHA